MDPNSAQDSSTPSHLNEPVAAAVVLAEAVDDVVLDVVVAAVVVDVLLVVVDALVVVVDALLVVVLLAVPGMHWEYQSFAYVQT